MKVVSLNTWGGKINQDLLDFFRDNNEVDVFCLQEIFHELDSNISTDYYINTKEGNKNLFNDISNVLNNHKSIFCPIHDTSFGLAIFVKNDLKIELSGSIEIYKNENYDPEDIYNDHGRRLQWVKLSNGFHILNIHGHWTMDKADNDLRIKQSKIITDFIKSLDNKKIILCGDFNLSPNTQSIQNIEDAGMTNLIKKYNIESTRTELFVHSEKHADYIFTSKDIDEKDFKVLPLNISDHATLLLEI